MTRVQKERLDPSEYANVKAQFILTSADLVNVKDNLKILHPRHVSMKLPPMLITPLMLTISNKQVMVFTRVRHYLP